MSTFISYSRVNSEFVVRMAKDLKAAGFDVWLDQLDIPKGARWDDAIEAAVERSSTFMIVLAPESIESQNVKDELSYAIDSGKHILPVVIQPCKIPLRLRRFQYVNFTEKPYRESLAQIKQLLSNTKQIPKVDVDPFLEQEDAAPLVKGPLIQREPIYEPEPISAVPSRAERSRLQKFALPALLAVIAIAAITGVVALAANRNTPLPPTATASPTPIPSTLAPTDTPSPPPEQIVDLYGVTMRFVSGGDFRMGSDGGSTDEQPVQALYVDPFYIDKYEVTNKLYRACVQAGACQQPDRVNSVTHVSYYSRPDFENYPVVYVDWNMARSFCAWRGARLPTEAEWEKAARGADGRTYPWGEGISCNQANFGGCQSDTEAASNHGSGLSPYGVSNMAGNVSEWVSSLYMPYPYDPTDGREELNTSGDRVIRGGSWIKSNSKDDVRSARRQYADPSFAAENLGFRCVSTLDNFVLVTGLSNEPPQNGFTATALVATLHVHRTKEANGSLAMPVSSSTLTSRSALTATLMAQTTKTTQALVPVTTATEGGVTAISSGVTPDSGGVTPDAGVTPDSSGVTPDSGGGVQPPDSGGTDQPPDSGGATQPPASGGGDQPPDSGGATQPPASGGGDQPPDSGGGSQPPDSGGATQPPATGGS